MRYLDIRPGIFISRPNRFIAHVEIGGQDQICHVKNTGRCRELLVPGAQVFVQEKHDPSRRTCFDLISVQKGPRLINIDSSAPNAVFREWLTGSSRFGVPSLISPETRYGSSRLDFYIESVQGPRFIEVKGVTLEDAGIVRFPDAPTERGVKHMDELIRSIGDGYRAAAAFVIQMEGVKWFEPNWDTHPAFGQTVERCVAGVELIAFDCHVTEDSIVPGKMVEIRL